MRKFNIIAMSANSQSLSNNAIPQLQRVGLNSLITSLVLDADSGNSSLVVRTGSNASLYIDKYSNVGINTTSPGAQFEVASANGSCVRLRYGASTTAYANIFMTSLGNLSINPNTAGSEIVTSASLNLSGHNGTSTGLKLNGTLVTASATQLNFNTVTAGTATNGKALVLSDTGNITGINSIGVSSITISTSTLTGTQASYLTGVTAGSASSGKAIVLDASGNIAGINTLNTSNLIVNGADVTASLSASAYVTNVTPGTATSNKALILNTDKTVNGITSIGTTSITINGSTISQEAAYLSGVETGAAAANKALVLNSSKNINGINNLNTTTLNLGGTSLTNIHADYLTSITTGTAQANKALVLDANKDITGIRTLSLSGRDTLLNLSNVTAAEFVEQTLTSDTYSLKVGVRGTSNSTNAGTAYLNYNNGYRLLISSTGEVSVGTTTFGYRLNIGGSVNAASYNLNGTAVDLTLISGITAGTATASKAVILDASKSVSGIGTLSATTINGAIATSTQPSITSVGTLTSLATSGAIATTINNNTATSSSYQTWTNSLATAMTVGLSMNNVSPAFGTSSNHKLRLQANNTDAIFIQASGNVSIGSDVDTYKLNVSGTLNATSYNLNGTAVDLTLISGITAGTAIASKAVILDGNKSITGISSLTATTINGSVATASQPSITSVGTLTSLATSGAIATTINNNTATSSSYQTWTNSLATAMKTNNTDVVFIQTSGNVSIGSDVDTYKLNIAGTLNATTYYLNGTALDFSSSTYLSSITPGSASPSKALVTDSNTALSNMGVIKFSSTGRPFVEGSDLGGGSYIGNWGATDRWGIGQHTTGTALAIRIGGCDSSGNWNGSYPTVYSGTFSAMSDYRLKKNFRDVPFGLETINRLRPLMHDFKYNGMQDQLGFIAHEVQDIIPSIVSGSKDAIDSNGKEQHQSISYIGLIPVTVKAIQELSAKNAKLEAIIETIMEENAQMKKMLMSLLSNHNSSDMS